MDALAAGGQLGPVPAAGFRRPGPAGARAGRATGPDLPAGMLAIQALALLILVAVILAGRRLPVRIDAQTDETISLRFLEAGYADRFAEANAAHVVGGRRPRERRPTGQPS